MPIQPKALLALERMPAALAHSPIMGEVAAIIDDVARVAESRQPYLTKFVAGAELEAISGIEASLRTAAIAVERNPVVISAGDSLDTGLLSRLSDVLDEVSAARRDILETTRGGDAYTAWEQVNYGDLIETLAPGGHDHRQLARAVRRHTALLDAFNGPAALKPRPDLSLREAADIVGRSVEAEVGTVPNLAAAIERLDASASVRVQAAVEHIGRDLGEGFFGFKTHDRVKAIPERLFALDEAATAAAAVAS